MTVSRCLPLLLLPALVCASVPDGSCYTASGDLVVPGDYREWVYLSSGIDMIYSKGAPIQGASMFYNVFVGTFAEPGTSK